MRRARGNQKQFLNKIAETMRVALVKADLKADVSTREKHLYSIYRKMQTKGRSLAEIVDVFGFRVIVADTDDCYRALGLVHHLYTPMPGRFKDYIAIPKANGYQSLHTTLFGPNGIPIEIQIRTEDMHRVAEAGIAAHWKYKVGEPPMPRRRTRAREWLQNLMDMQEGGNSEEFLESVKVDLFPDKVYVFTPKGEIRRLPRGATCVDFAYAVHTDVGNRCVAAKVDRRLAPLRTQLRNGQTVEIITAKGATPNPSWVNFVVTAKARTAIRHYLKNLKRRTEAIELGPRLLNQALGEFRAVAVKKCRQDTLDFRGGRARHARRPTSCSRRSASASASRRSSRAPAARTRRQRGIRSGAPAPLAIAGTEGAGRHYARCCFPIPDDPIFALLSSAGRGVVVHRENCGNLADYRKQPEKWMPVAWTGESIDKRVQSRSGSTSPTRWACSPPSRAISDRARPTSSAWRRRADADSSTLVVRASRTQPAATSRAWSSASAACPRCSGHAYNRQPRARPAIRHALRAVREVGIRDTMESSRQASTDAAPEGHRHLFAGVRAGDTVYLAGQIPLDPATMQLVEGDFEKPRSRRVFDNLKAVARSGRRHVSIRSRRSTSSSRRSGRLREGQRSHGGVLRPTLPGARRGGRGGAAARRPRRNRRDAWSAGRLVPIARKHRMPDVSNSPSAARRLLRGVGPALARKARAARRHDRAGPAVPAAATLRGPHARSFRSAACAPGERAVVEGEIQLTEVLFRRRRLLLCRIADGTGC